MSATIIDFPDLTKKPSDDQQQLGNMAYRLLDKPRGLPRRPFPPGNGPEAA